MPYIPEQQINTGSYLETTSVFDVGSLAQADPGSAEFKELVVKLAQKVNDMLLVLNKKDSAYYLTEQFVTGQLYFNPLSDNPLDLRAGFRIVIDVGPIGAGVTSVAHGLAITSTWKFTKILGAASNTGTLVYYPLPFAGATGNNIEVRVTSTQLVITNNSGVTFTDVYVNLEYVKN
jgi:hypothetical protein